MHEVIVQKSIAANIKDAGDILKRGKKVALGILVAALALATGCSANDSLFMCTYQVGSHNSENATFVKYEWQPSDNGCDPISDSAIGIGNLQESRKVY